MTAIIHVVGNLTKDPETREAGKSSVTKLSVASNRRVKGENVPTYYIVSVWGKPGESAARFFGKGDSIHVWGEHAPSEYESGSGETRVSEDIENASWGFAGKTSGGGPRTDSRADEQDYPF